jgi:hypothetical protein
MYYGTKMKTKQFHPHAMDSSNVSLKTRVKVTLIAKSLLKHYAQM